MKKKETSPDGSKDENVFDIQQGVAISIMIRKSDKKEKLGTVKFFEVFGTRTKKFYTLNETETKNIKWQDIKLQEPNYFFCTKGFQI